MPLVYLPGRISETESLFYYAGNTYTTYNTRDFTPLFLDEVLGNMTKTDRAEAEKTCGDNRECLFDYVVTGQSVIIINNYKKIF